GWTFKFPAERRIELGPREKRWVDLTIEPGPEVLDHGGNQDAVTITGTIDGRVIGGMTFYVAASRKKSSQDGDRHHRNMDGSLMQFDIPWRTCDIEGEIDIRLRFRNR